MMIAREAPPEKRQKRSLSPPLLVFDEISSLDGVEGSYDDCDEEEDSYQDLAREEALLDRVLTIFEEYEEDSLVEQSRLRSRLSKCGISKIDSVQQKLQHEKVRCGLFKVLTLLLQSGTRLRGSSHRERVDLMRQVKHVLEASENYSLEELKKRFVLLFSSLRKDLFPPSSIIALPTNEETCSLPRKNTLYIQQLMRATQDQMSRLDQAAKHAIQQRLLDDNYSSAYGEECENMREVWHVWLQFPITSSEQLCVWSETLEDCENLDSLLWNLAFCLSMTPDECY